MKLQVRVKPGSRKPGVERLSDGSWLVAVREPATEGKANEAVERAIAEELGLPRRRVTIVMGHGSRSKLVLVEEG